MSKLIRKLLGLIFNIDQIGVDGKASHNAIRDKSSRRAGWNALFKIATCIAFLGCLFPYFAGIRLIAGHGFIGYTLEMAAIVGMTIGLYQLSEHLASKEWPTNEKKREFWRYVTISIWLTFAALYGPAIISPGKPPPSSDFLF